MSLHRREFLLASVAAAAATPSTLAAGLSDLVVSMTDSPVFVNSLGTLFGFDAPPPLPGTKPLIVESRPEMVTDSAVRDTLAAGISAVNVTVGHVAGDIDPFEHSVADIGRWNRIILQRSTQLTHVLKADDILNAKRAGKVGVILGSQNSTMLGDRAERVDVFADLGLRVFQLTYNSSTSVGDGSTGPDNGPLTPLGRSVVERLADRRVLCDLSHSGRRTCLDAVRHSTRPVAITHTGCSALVDVPRNKSDEELRLVAERGGYIGIYFMPFLTDSGPAKAEHVARHIEHAIKVCGEDHVGIGTDGPMSAVPNMAEYLEAQRQYIAHRRSQGIAAPGEREDAPFFVVDLQGPEQYRMLAKLLRSRGHSQARVDKIMGLNFIRVARDVWG
ncbi:membrane dipeptidase [Pseudoxanthomonas japonensis]|uniref:dipeptidase n=1 Tax=Pseudoxanthomonas japonensis TaxID=69284 RepID=UPI00285BC60C|nr:membrane dipeptidase [Pseudoxanthomonas japonensis]MDR7070059.1 membrane dipeptidase [Pseudoxanthomonas japonensis]